MNYDLAKELKDAGFPQTMKAGSACLFEGKEYIHTGGGHLEAGGRTEGLYVEKGATCCLDDEETPVPLKNIYDDLVIKIPTLEELIEACGVDFNKLVYGGPDKGELTWSVRCHMIEHQVATIQYGPTPTEAVARLWLALNKK